MELFVFALEVMFELGMFVCDCADNGKGSALESCEFNLGDALLIRSSAGELLEGEAEFCWLEIFGAEARLEDAPVFRFAVLMRGLG